MEFLRKIFKLNTWSWVSLFGYLELITFLLGVICIFIYNDGAYALAIAILLVLLGMIYFIIPIILFILECCGVKIRNIKSNKVAFVIGILIHILLGGYSFYIESSSFVSFTLQNP